MRQLRDALATLVLASMLAACGSGKSAEDAGNTFQDGGSAGQDGGSTGQDGGSMGQDGGNSGHDGGTRGDASCPAGTGMGVGHVVIVIQENHTFDTYFGRWCTAAPGSNPSCTSGPSCCEAGPAMEPSGASPVTLDDPTNAGYSPNHNQSCELAEIDLGKMDKFVTGTSCSNAGNFAYAPDILVKPYHDLAAQNAIADRYFQPIAGASSSNDLYLAVAKEVFIDNAYEPKAPGSQCELDATTSYSGQKTIADLLMSAGKSVAWYSEGWAATVAAGGARCTPAPSDCPASLSTYPCIFDPGDVPFLYYTQFESNSQLMRDYEQLTTDLVSGTLPDVSFVKALGYHTEHPGSGTTISAGVTFVTGLVQSIEASCYKDSSLVLVTWDEGGGFFDHLAPSPTSSVDNQPYGTRVPLLAIGHYALTGTVSHAQMEHSSLVKFLEWNFLNGATGQLGARDAVVNNIGSLLDPTKTAVPVPAQ